MVLESLKGLLRPDETYTYQCNDCGEEFETEETREYAKCPECGGPPEPAWQE
jgi:predicted Zn-ribbon and HTH transcriptional regulator